jgi:hypothetical protein
MDGQTVLGKTVQAEPAPTNLFMRASALIRQSNVGDR